MAARRSAAVFVVVLFVLATLGVSARGQFGNLLKKTLPKPPGTPTPAARLYCQDITPEKVEQLLKGLEAEKAAHEKAQELDKAVKNAENAAKARQSASDQVAGQRMMAAMERQAACEQAAQEKDPRFKQAERLSELRNKAQDRGDDAAADRYGEQYAALTDELEKVARTACSDQACLAKARAESGHHALIAELKAAAAREKDANRKAALEAQIPAYLAMIESEAQVKCSAMGAAAYSADEQAASASAADAVSRAADAARQAREGKDDEGAKNANMTRQEYQRMKECAIGALNNPSATPLTPESQKAFDQRQQALGPALKASGN